MSSEPFQPKRKHLPHDVPIWINQAAEVYFVTINCRTRCKNSLCHDALSEQVIDSVCFRHEHRHWYCHLFLLMPDHLHALLSFPHPTKTIQRVISDWKRWTAGQMRIHWQPSYFEHRLRNDREVAEASQYILENPVRKGLVERWQDWKYVWRPNAE